MIFVRFGGAVLKVILQRVQRAKVCIDGETVSEIGKGLLAFVAMKADDNEETIDYILDKIQNLRIFEDNDGKMNLSVRDVNGEILFVPNFTIYGNTIKGRRPSYTDSAPPDIAREIFRKFEDAAKKAVECDKLGFGVFQADMQVELINDGPVTLIVER